ncbi:3-oxoacyl-ACP synthase III [Desulfosarcina ovata subsp. sediminis]|uniref:3-oxoacyl-ACP synthase III n=1 Tax=Desulfosarcina ovata subsp. sediminis TaxID=885957 RepID=A0A5K7ZVK2_9BACT|nr:3-oxoacyl-ACP synthase III [Desulfosarcina ovata]BBO84273.1 3-oxoacyl-ACP synthase III [Desulfosarcina ovata subsp. sediminis]
MQPLFFNNVAIEAVECVLPTTVVTSAQIESQLSATMVRIGIKPGMIQGLTGIRERRFWDAGQQASDVATRAAEKVLAKADIPRDAIGCLISTSVSKDYIEPSVASLVHGNLGLADHCISYDIGNACLGFVNAMASVGMMIDSGFVDYGLIVDGENSREVVEATIDRLSRPDATAEAFRDQFATLTLGSGAVAMIVCRCELSTSGHRINGAVTRAATRHSRLCLGQRDYMTADASKVMLFGVDLAKQTWDLAGRVLANWSDDEIDAYIPHQVSQRNMDVLNEKLGLTPQKHHLNFPTLGNIGPAAVPITLNQAAETGRVRPGNHVALMGIGSGLNCSMMSVTW